jgi:hypothetical protein
MHCRSIWAATAMVIYCVAFLGCGSGASVTGKVVYDKDGAPLTKGTVMFVSDDGHLARADVRSDGTFDLRGGGGKAGVQPGKYGVCILPPDTASQRENGINVPPVIDARFLSTETSGLQFDVKPGKNDFTVTVSKPAGG